MMDFKDKVCLITGGGTGVGKATAMKFCEQGAHVVIANRRVEVGQEALRQLQQVDKEALFVETDVSKEEQVEKLVARVLEQFGTIDCAFNCGGLDGKRAELIDCEETDWDAIMNVNLKGTFFLLKHEIKAMLQNGKGTIVNMASVSGYFGRTKRCAYNASRAGVMSLTKTAAMEYIGRGIRINAIAPAAIRTDIFERMTEGRADLREKYAKLHPIGRVAEPEEIADTVLWLCSERSSFVVGQTIIVDGGVMVNSR